MHSFVHSLHVFLYLFLVSLFFFPFSLFVVFFLHTNFSSFQVHLRARLHKYAIFYATFIALFNAIFVALKLYHYIARVN